MGIAAESESLEFLEWLLCQEFFKQFWKRNIYPISYVFVRTCENGKEEAAELFLRHYPQLINYDDYENCLMAAIKNRHAGLAKLLIKKGAVVNIDCRVNIRHRSLLSITVEMMQWEIAGLLVDHGANVHKDSREMLISICSFGPLDLLRKFIDNGCSTYKSSVRELVREAVYCNRVEFLKYFQVNGEDIFLKGYFLSIAVKRNNIDCVKLLCSTKPSKYYLRHAWLTALTSKAEIDCIRYLHSMFPFQMNRHGKVDLSIIAHSIYHQMLCNIFLKSGKICLF